jgi:hypothetical protein
VAAVRKQPQYKYTIGIVSPQLHNHGIIVEGEDVHQLLLQGILDMQEEAQRPLQHPHADRLESEGVIDLYRHMDRLYWCL